MQGELGEHTYVYWTYLLGYVSYVKADTSRRASSVSVKPCVDIKADLEQESRAVARKPSDTAAVLFGLKFADDIHKFKCSQAWKDMLHSSKLTGTKQNLTQNGDTSSFKVTCFGVSGKAIRH